jgi:uncharacterized membrane protein YdbT with pleckstrin-like domain
VAERVRSWHPDEVVRGLMVDREVIYALEQPEWRLVLLDQAPLALLGVFVSLLATKVLGPVPGLLVFALLAAIVAYRALDAWHTRYVLTSFRVMRFSGVFDRNVEFIPWRKVTDVSLHRSFWERLVGASTIRIESANERSRFREMKDVRNPRDFFAKLQEMTAAYSGSVEVGMTPLDLGWDD